MSSHVRSDRKDLTCQSCVGYAHRDLFERYRTSDLNRITCASIITRRSGIICSRHSRWIETKGY